MATRSLGRYSVSRRRLISTAGIGATGLLGSALLGCSTSSKRPASNPTVLADAVKTPAPAQPKRGGTLKISQAADIESLDYVSAAASAGQTPTNLTMSRLIKYDSVINATPSDKIIGDLAKSWEQPDPQTIVFKLDPAAKFDTRQPTDGRTVTAEDVVQTWKHFAALGGYRVALSNAASKNAAVTAVEAIDASTVRMKLAFPEPTILGLLAQQTSFWIQPTEGLAGKYELAKEIRGSGPFVLESWKTAVSFTYKRNPNWHLGLTNGQPYVDGLSQPIIPQQVQREVQFRSKNLHAAAVTKENIVRFAKELPGTKIVSSAPGVGGQHLGLSYASGQPWHDVRVRRAVSMSFDRDTFANVFFNPKQYAEFGLDLPVYWNTPLPPAWGDYWLDPKGAEFGPAAAYLKHNVPEAKKLLDAAGFTSAKPLEFDLVYPGTRLSTSKPDEVTAWAAMAKDAGIKINNTALDYATDYIPKYWRAKGQYEGRNVKAAAQESPGGTGPNNDVISWLAYWFASGGALTVTGTVFPEIDAMFEKLRPVTDVAARKQGAKDLQRYLVDQMICIPAGPSIKPVDLIWGGLRGPGEIAAWGGGAPGAMEYHGFWFEEPI